MQPYPKPGGGSDNIAKSLCTITICTCFFLACKTDLSLFTWSWILLIQILSRSLEFKRFAATASPDMTDAVQWRVGTEVTVFRFFESDAKRPFRLKPGMMGIVVGVDGPWTSQANLHVQVSFGRKKKWRSTWVFPHLHLDAMMPRARIMC